MLVTKLALGGTLQLHHPALQRASHLSEFSRKWAQADFHCRDTGQCQSTPNLRCSQGGESSTSDDSDLATSSSESESDDGEGYGSVDLTHERIMSLQRKLDRKSSTYAKTGGSTKRMRNALGNPICSCACRLPLKLLVRICLAFWSLVKQEQDSLLWSLQNEHGKNKTRWHLQGPVFWFSGFMFEICWL
jgi:hypothetical protein